MRVHKHERAIESSLPPPLFSTLQSLSLSLSPPFFLSYLLSCSFVCACLRAVIVVSSFPLLPRWTDRARDSAESRERSLAVCALSIAPGLSLVKQSKRSGGSERASSVWLPSAKLWVCYTNETVGAQKSTVDREQAEVRARFPVAPTARNWQYLLRLVLKYPPSLALACARSDVCYQLYAIEQRKFSPPISRSIWLQ